MKIKLFLGKESRSLDIAKGQNVESLLKKLRINPQTVIVSRNGEVVSEQEALKDKDTLRIMRFK